MKFATSQAMQVAMAVISPFKNARPLQGYDDCARPLKFAKAVHLDGRRLSGHGWSGSLEDYKTAYGFKGWSYGNMVNYYNQVYGNAHPGIEMYLDEAVIDAFISFLNYVKQSEDHLHLITGNELTSEIFQPANSTISHVLLKVLDESSSNQKD